MRIIQLDVLRGIAILLVLGRHFPFFHLYSGFGAGFFTLWKRIGWIGVDLFFVLSGFLVSGLLFKEYKASGKINLKLFLIRRGFKIYPAYYFLILFTIVFYLTIFHLIIPAKFVLSQLFFLQNYISLQGYIYFLWGHLWTLAVEEHFYLLVGLLVFFCSKRKLTDPFTGLVPMFYVMGAGCLALRLINNLCSGHNTFVEQRDFYPTHLRIDSLMFGVLLAYWHHFHFPKIKTFFSRNKFKVLGAGAFLLVPVFLFELVKTPFIYTLGLTINYLALGAVMMVSLYCTDMKDNRFDFLSKVGRHSYSIYLWHLPILHWIIIPMVDFTGTSGTGLSVLILLYFLFTIGLGVLMARIIEIPFLKYRDRLCLQSTQVKINLGSSEVIG